MKKQEAYSCHTWKGPLKQYCSALSELYLLPKTSQTQNELPSFSIFASFHVLFHCSPKILVFSAPFSSNVSSIFFIAKSFFFLPHFSSQNPHISLKICCSPILQTLLSNGPFPKFLFPTFFNHLQLLEAPKFLFIIIISK